MKEENAENIERAAKTVQITGRVSQAVKDEFEQLRENGGYETFSLFMEALLERYNNPLKINKENVAKIAELQRTIEMLTSEIKHYEADNSAVCETINKERKDFEDLRAEHNAALAKIEQLQREKSTLEQTANEYDTLKTEVDGCISVPVTPLDMKCLKYLADRENRKRKRNDITPAKFFMFAIREVFIEGNKFSIDCVPDRIIKKFEEEIANGQ